MRRPHISRAPLRFGRLSRTLAVGAGLATARFPVAAILIVLFSLASNLEVAELRGAPWPEFPRLISALLAGAVASIAARLFGESRGWAALPLALAPLLAACGAASLVWFGQPLEVHAGALLPALTFSIFLAPFAGRGTARQFWTFTLWASVGVVLAFLSVLLFVAGLLAILEMVRFLFAVGFGSTAYAHIFVTALTLVGPLFALGRIPPLSTEELSLREDDRLVLAVRPMFDWVAAPLALLTSAILHLYALRIIVSGEVPVGEIGWIVTFFSILVLSIRVAIDPFLDSAALPARIFAKAWAAMLVVPLGLLAYAATLRIGSEGFTLERYYLVLGGIAAAGAVLFQALPRVRGDVRVIAAVPVVLLGLSVAGPWGAENVVGRSQAARIADEMPLTDGLLDRSLLTQAQGSRLRSRILALDEVSQLQRLAPLLSEADALALQQAFEPGSEEAGRRFARALGLRPGGADAGRSYTSMTNRPLATSGFDVAFTSLGVSQAAPEGAATPGRSPISAHLNGRTLVLQVAGIEDRFDLGPMLDGLPAAPEGAGEIEPPVAEITSEAGRGVRLRLESAFLGPDAVPQSMLLTVLLRSADWPPALLGGG